jgi:hypothetical protein
MTCVMFCVIIGHCVKRKNMQHRSLLTPIIGPDFEVKRNKEYDWLKGAQKSDDGQNHYLSEELRRDTVLELTPPSTHTDTHTHTHTNPLTNPSYASCFAGNRFCASLAWHSLFHVIASTYRHLQEHWTRPASYRDTKPPSSPIALLCTEACTQHSSSITYYVVVVVVVSISFILHCARYCVTSHFSYRSQTTRHFP